jgi:hypothetical protein
MYSSLDIIAVTNWNEAEMGEECSMEGRNYKFTRFLVGKRE